MINVYELLPENYYRDSRDFQLIGRLFEACLNYNKTAVDILNNNFIYDEQFLDLAAYTVGFIRKHEYNNIDLSAVISCFNTLLKNKGTKKAIEDCCRVLLRAQNIKQEPIVTVTNKLNENYIYKIEIVLPVYLTDTILLEDVLDYILPAGYIYELIVGKKVPDTYSTDFALNEKLDTEKELIKITAGVTQYNNESKSALSLVAPGNVTLKEENSSTNDTQQES